MLQYLLNATAIWLLSLTLFDIFLCRESYHNYNRFYLLFTYLLGAFLPLWQLQDDSAVFRTSLKQPLEQVINVKQNITATATPSSLTISAEQYILYVYLLGIVVSVLLLIVEIIKIVRLYQNSRRSREGSCIIIETGIGHSPFSLLNLVFVSSKENYSKEEWDMLIAHEQMHGLLLHFIDVLLIQVARIIFWFHPLVYLYQKRLMMQHEYQADHASAGVPKFYGQFLIEQSILQRAPSISHSFNRSPIKNRIVMLTRKSSLAAKSKMLVFAPLVLICTIFFSKNSFSQKYERDGNTVTYNGNKFEMSKPDTVEVTMLDPVTGKEMTKELMRDPKPAKMNGQTIYADEDIRNAPNPKLGTVINTKAGIDGKGLKEYLLSNIKDELAKLPDTTYDLTISNVVIDDKGKIVYYEYGGVSVIGFTNGEWKTTPIDKGIDQKILRKIHTLINEAPRHTPANVNSKDVPSVIYSGGSFKLRNHTVVEL